MRGNAVRIKVFLGYENPNGKCAICGILICGAHERNRLSLERLKQFEKHFQEKHHDTHGVPSLGNFKALRIRSHVQVQELAGRQDKRKMADKPEAKRCKIQEACMFTHLFAYFVYY